ncbi:hypothetical protein [Chitinimonas sp. BJB300]|uniref:hypothetical protein n=1 Tax=Chitinimonas sp. BJB300 TaxID=1559339 RepID=UPI000C10E4E8|nr:hypothetical protein [Chitinimonas sp. BJB300]PHV09594.1 hypothetical protein CSQ89_20870 [Chitinimonas sp. BJB300]
MARKEVDWEGIEGDYRAGVLSLREIGRKFDVSDTLIRRKAKELRWERDLSEKVQAEVRAELVRTEVRNSQARTNQCEPANLRTKRTADPKRDREIVEAAAATGVAVVMSHRRDVAAARGIASLLLNELHDASQDIEAIEAAILTETQDDAGNLRRNQMMKAVSLSTRAGTVRDLSTALKNLVTIERQAFGLDRGDDDKKKATPMMHIHAGTQPATPTQMEEPNE